MDSDAFARRHYFIDQFAAGKPVDVVYDEYATTYDDDAKYFVSDGHLCIFAAVEKCSEGRDGRILDVGAGTGVCGVELAKRGYTNIDAVEPSLEMLKVAETKGVYRHIHHQFVGPQPLPIPNDTYDVVMGRGVIAPNHLPANALPDLIRVLKPGGHLVIQGNYTIWCRHPEFHVTMANELERLVTAGEWTQVEWTVLEDYYASTDKCDDTGLLFVYRKL